MCGLRLPQKFTPQIQHWVVKNKNQVEQGLIYEIVGIFYFLSVLKIMPKAYIRSLYKNKEFPNYGLVN